MPLIKLVNIQEKTQIYWFSILIINNNIIIVLKLRTCYFRLFVHIKKKEKAFKFKSLNLIHSSRDKKQHQYIYYIILK